MSIIIVGGGAAGLLAAGTAALNTTEKVVLIEKNQSLGKKLRVTGNGRCNITNVTDVQDMIEKYPTNGKFLYSALNTFTNEDIVSLIEGYGVKTKVERGGRIFPESDKAEDVVEALRKYALQANTVRMNAEVHDIIISDGVVKGVKTSKGVVKGDKVIICTGGKSCIRTGSTGDGYKFAKNAGHTIVPIRPSLIPIVTEEKWVKELAGLTLKNVELKVCDENDKVLYKKMGHMLITHFGISGPIVLSASAHLRANEKYKFYIDLKPKVPGEKIESEIFRDTRFKKRHLINSLSDMMPNSLVPIVLELANLKPHKRVCDINSYERDAIVNVMKAMPLTFKGFRPLNEAIITGGGVATDEINPSTMESRLVKGLYFAGEVIDVDGYTGGYNLQEAFSTGYVAGANAAWAD